MPRLVVCLLLTVWSATICLGRASMAAEAASTSTRNAAAVHEEGNGDGDGGEVRLWSSTGGGWRAMFACVGYANIFKQAGLLTRDRSEFSAIVSFTQCAAMIRECLANCTMELLMLLCY
mmetsp:Transcript_36922/g.75244  ORF Transcript_36922/g.75244 Transcript_36922/m.75244 type:complete len:119 (-) Transcript_36922:125-481(-)